LIQLVDEAAQSRLEGIARELRALPSSPIHAARLAGFFWQHDLFLASWKTLWHRSKAQAAVEAGDRDQAREHWLAVLSHGQRAADYWPDNPTAVRHAHNAVTAARHELELRQADAPRQLEDEVAAQMIAAVTSNDVRSMNR
jgi:hypothetical protein